MAAASLFFDIFARDKTKGTFDSVSKKAGTLGDKMDNAGKKMAKFGVVAVAAAVAAAPKVIDMAAGLELMGRKSETVFGDQLPTVKRWASANAQAMGLTSKEAVGLAANFGDLLIPMGFTRDQAAKMSTDVVGLSGALSEWSNGTRSAAEVSEILAKAMLGERDSLKELGISIMEADVQQRLMRKGQQDLTGAALEQAKAIATQELIFEKSTDAQAAYAKGQDSLARKTAEAKAALKETGEELLTAITPALKSITGFVTDDLIPSVRSIIETFDALPGPVKDSLGTIAGIAITAPLAVSAFRKVQDAAKSVGTSFTGVGKKAVIATGGFIALQAAGAGLHALFGKDLTVDLEALSLGLERWAKQNKISGEAARFLGKNAGELTGAFEQLASWSNFAAEPVQGLMETFTSFEGSITTAEKLIGLVAQALAGLVNEGKPEVAAEAFKNIAKMANDAGISTEKLTALMSPYTAAQEKANEKAKESPEASKAAADGMGELGDKAGDAAESIDDLIGSLDEANSTFFASRDAARGYEEAIDDAAAAVTENGRTLDINTEQGRENQAALDDVAEAAMKHNKATLQDAAANGTLGSVLPTVERRIKDQRAAFVAAAVAAGMEERKARDLAKKLIAIPKNVKTKITAQDNASRTIGDIKAKLAGIKDKTVRLSVAMAGVGAVRALEGLAHGGRFSRGKVALVGEEGPEIVRFDGSGEVVPNRESMRMLRGGGGGMSASSGPQRVVVEFDFRGDADLVRFFRKAINSRGGSVQKVLGS